MVVGIEVRRGRKVANRDFADTFTLKLTLNEDKR